MSERRPVESVGSFFDLPPWPVIVVALAFAGLYFCESTKRGDYEPNIIRAIKTWPSKCERMAAKDAEARKCREGVE